MQGDVLAGSLAVMVAWALESLKEKGSSSDSEIRSSLVTAAFGASLIARHAQKAAFERHRRSMLAQDVINELGTTIEYLFDKWKPPMLHDLKCWVTKSCIQIEHADGKLVQRNFK